jgi:hypothetical protein
MPAMKFYFTDEERKELFNFIQLKGGAFVPDLHFYNTDKYYIIANGDEFLSHIQQKEITHYFLIDNVFAFEPIVVSINKFRKEPAYSIEQRTGGPYIDLSFYLGHADDATIPYKYSMVDIYSKFIHFNSHDEFKAPDELKKYYNDIVKYIKSKCSVVIKDNKKYWVGHDALKEINSR